MRYGSRVAKSKGSNVMGRLPRCGVETLERRVLLSSQPFGGQPVNVNTSVVQAENFDTGGEGVAYHDTDPRNTGGQYRPGEGVDIANDPGGAAYGNPTNGLVVVNTQAGEWLQYTISVPTAGVSRVRASVRSAWSGGQFHVEMDGKPVGGEVTVLGLVDVGQYEDSDTGAFFLTAGVHVMRVVMDKVGPGGIVAAFDRFAVDEGGGGTFNLTPFNIATDTVEAENFNFLDYTDTTPQNINRQYRPFEPVDINAGGSNGFSVGYVMKGESLAYNIASPTNSVYQLQARVASHMPGGTFHVEIDGKNVTGPMTVPDSGPWDTWTTITSPAFAVSNATHVMTVVMDKGGFWEDVVGDIDYFKFVKTAQTAPPVVLHAEPYHGAPADISSQFKIQAEDYDFVRDSSGVAIYYDGEGVATHDTDAQNLGGQYRWNDSVDIIPGVNPASGANEYAVGYTAPGEWLQYTISVPSAGSYALQSRVANLLQGGTFHMEIDGANKTGTLTVPATGGYRNWVTVNSKPFTLSAGVHVMRVVMDSAGPQGNIGNFDFFDFTGVTSLAASGSGALGAMAVNAAASVHSTRPDQNG